jgi:hypothetical protein
MTAYGSVERDNFTVDDGIAGKLQKRARYTWKSAAEILVVA